MCPGGASSFAECDSMIVKQKCKYDSDPCGLFSFENSTGHRILAKSCTNSSWCGDRDQFCKNIIGGGRYCRVQCCYDNLCNYVETFLSTTPKLPTTRAPSKTLPQTTTDKPTEVASDTTPKAPVKECWMCPGGASSFAECDSFRVRQKCKYGTDSCGLFSFQNSTGHGIFAKSCTYKSWCGDKDVFCKHVVGGGKYCRVRWCYNNLCNGVNTFRSTTPKPPTTKPKKPNARLGSRPVEECWICPRGASSFAECDTFVQKQKCRGDLDACGTFSFENATGHRIFAKSCTYKAWCQDDGGELLQCEIKSCYRSTHKSH